MFLIINLGFADAETARSLLWRGVFLFSCCCRGVAMHNNNQRVVFGVLFWVLLVLGVVGGVCKMPQVGQRKMFLVCLDYFFILL
jgi:hypothetical protein